MRRLIPILLLAAGNAWAHPDHGAWGISLAHLLTEPDHLAMLILPLAIAAGVWYYRKQKKR